jgi:hypothetical protein
MFSYSHGGWVQQARLLASNPAGPIGFGFAVSISGDQIVVGAPYENSSTTGVNSTPDSNGSYTGAAYAFQRSGSTWAQLAYLKASNTRDYYEFGSSVGISQGTIIAGSIYESSNATGVNGSQSNTSASNSGAAYIFAPTAVNITVDTSPSGLLFNSSGAGCDPGSNYVAPRVLSWVPGSSCTLSVSTPQNGYVFSQWDDASTNPSRSITAPSVDTSYTATFTMPATTNVTINVPTGIQFNFNGTLYTNSQTISIAQGTYILSTTSPQSTGVGSQAGCSRDNRYLHHGYIHHAVPADDRGFSRRRWVGLAGNRLLQFRHRRWRDRHAERRIRIHKLERGLLRHGRLFRHDVRTAYGDREF